MAGPSVAGEARHPLQSVGRGGARWPGQHPGHVLQQLQPAVEGATAHHLESHIGVAVVDPVTTGKTTTRKRSTRPASNRERHRVRLPMVRMDASPPTFISRTASTGSSLTSLVFGHESGSDRLEEKTTFDSPARSSVPGTPSSASPDMSR